MGYSITTPIKSEKAKKYMLAFLRQHYNPTLDPYARGPIDRDLSYDHGPCRIGFDATSTSDYMISVCAWIALKVGKMKVYPTKALPKVAGPCKYLRYDGYQDWPLLITQRHREKLGSYIQVNWVGCLVPELQPYDVLAGRTNKLFEIEEELKRLESRWTEYTTTNPR